MLKGFLPHTCTHPCTFALSYTQDILDAFQRKVKWASYFSSLVFSKIAWILSNGCTPPPIILYFPHFLLGSVLHSGLWSFMCSWRIQIMLSEQMYTHTTMLFSHLSPSAQTQSHNNTLTFLPFLPFPCWAVCHSREVRHHVILQWCIERIQPRVPRGCMSTNQTSVTGFQQHEKYIMPGLKCPATPFRISLHVLRPLHWMSHRFCCVTPGS